MKRQSFPLWLLRDVPALMGFLASFWAMVIFGMTSGRRLMRTDRIGKQVRDHLALMLAHAEAKLDYALWRHAYRRLGWNPNLVRLHIIAPTIVWSDTQEHFANYAQAFCNMNRVVDAYVDDLRQRYSIVKRDVTDGLSPLRLVASRQSTSPGFADGGEEHRCLSSLSAKHWGRWIAASSRRDGGGSHNCRGPPFRLAQNLKIVTLPQRMHA